MIRKIVVLAVMGLTGWAGGGLQTETYLVEEGVARAEIVVAEQAPRRANLAAPGFTAVDGYRFVYEADFDGEIEIQAVNELDTLSVLPRNFSKHAVEFNPGTFSMRDVGEHLDLAYGDHERNVLNFWQAAGEGPRPLVISIHGGGWTQGGKSRRPGRIGSQYLSRGISFAAIDYRLVGTAPLPAPVRDAARAVQFLRYRAEDLNIDRERIALTGSSAGGCSALWIALHADLADPDSPDPVLRESTRVFAAAVGNAQSSIDPMVIEEWIGPRVLSHRMIWRSVGASSMADVLANYDQYAELYKKFSPYNHLTPDDPPLMMTYGHPINLPPENVGHAIHHPVFGMKIRELSERIGHETHLLVRDGPRFSDYDSSQEFLIDKLLQDERKRPAGGTDKRL